MFCKSCGSALPAGSKFCSECGAANTQEAPVVAASEKTQQTPQLSKPPRNPIGFFAFIIIVGGVIGAIFHFDGTSASPGSHSGATLHYAVKVQGHMPASEIVGIPVELSIAAHNTGDDIPHLVLAFDGLGSWVINQASGCNGAGKPLDGLGNPYDFGPVSAGQNCAVTLGLTPKTPGNPTLSFLTYHDVSGDGTIDTNTNIDGNNASGQWTPAINP